MPIWVETTIRAPLEEVWRRTQQPELHARWDLRFSEIDYLPKPSPEAPQRFLYRTRIGFGLEIRGEGESTGERDAASGARVSALRFWSDETRSLIREGSGYWKYVPQGDGVRFLTVYDYTTRFGVAGRLLDRILFRPLMAWATAWSFDRLRRWIEEDADPSAAARQALAHVIARAGLAFAWIYQGLVPKLLFAQTSGELATTARVVGAELAPAAVRAAGIGELAFGVALLLFPRSRLLPILAIAALAGLGLVGGVIKPAILTGEFNAVSLTATMLALAAVDLVTARGLPSAARCRWSSRRVKIDPAKE